jgi:GntR family transcriptional repressor for pyruvate dehydrogenase complex
VATKLLSATVYDALLGRILGGELAAGTSLPSERRLSEDFGVNRHAVREAVKRLQQARLVQVSHGGATRVLDWRETAGLDLVEQLSLPASAQPELVRSVLEMRLCIGVDAARRCAERAPVAFRARLEDHVAALDPGSPDGALADAYEQLWRMVVDGAENLAYRLALNTLVGTGGQIGLRERSLAEARDATAQAALTAAIAAGDVDAADSAAHALLTRTFESERLAG